MDGGESEIVSQLTKCRACGAPVAVGAKTCPQCGADKPDASSTVGMVAGVGSLIVFAGIVAAIPNLVGGWLCLGMVIALAAAVWVGYVAQKSARKHLER